MDHREMNGGGPAILALDTQRTPKRHDDQGPYAFDEGQTNQQALKRALHVGEVQTRGTRVNIPAGSLNIHTRPVQNVVKDPGGVRCGVGTRDILGSPRWRRNKEQLRAERIRR